MQRSALQMVLPPLNQNHVFDFQPSENELAPHDVYSISHQPRPEVGREG